MIKRGGANRVKGKNHYFFQTGLRNQVEIYFHVKSGATRIKNEGVRSFSVGKNKYDKREGGTNMIKERGANRVKEKNH